MTRLNRKDTNEVILVGDVKSKTLEYSFSDEKFYLLIVEVKRLSGAIDILPVYSSELFCKDILTCMHVRIKGSYRSRNIIKNEKSHLILRIFATEEIKETNEDYTNEIVLSGTICKKPILRVTPSEKIISDVFLAVNRNFKTDYIPMIAWNRNAQKINKYDVGTKLNVIGRIQSREYTTSENETKLAYEVSIASFNKLIEQEEKTND